MFVVYDDVRYYIIGVVDFMDIYLFGFFIVRYMLYFLK